MKRFLIIAGEASGDLYGAMLVRAVRDLHSDIAFKGIGGARMLEAGVELIERVENLSVVGITEVLSHFRRLRRALSDVKKSIRNELLDGVVLIDFPDFNFLVGRFAKKHMLRVFYFVTPQVWAWRRGRLKTMRRFVYKCVPVLPFEPQMLRAGGIDAEYAGHPLLDISRPDSAPAEIRKRLGASADRRIIALFPGSREREVRVHLPLILEACRKINAISQNFTYLLSVAPTINCEEVKNLLKGYHMPVIVTQESAANIFSISEAGIAVSGTIALEGAIARKPLVIIYRLSWLTYFLVRPVVNVKYISLPNIIQDRMIYPELIQNDANPDAISSKLLEILEKERYNSILNYLDEAVEKLGSEGVFKKVSEIFLKSMVQV